MAATCEQCEGRNFTGGPLCEECFDNTLEADYQQCLTDCWNATDEAIDSLSQAVNIYNSLSNRGEDCEKFKRLEILLNQAQTVIIELDS